MPTQGLEIKTVTPQHTLALQAKVPLPQIGPKLGELFPAVFDYAHSVGAPLTGPPFVRYLSNGHDGSVELEVGVTVARPTPGKGAIQAGQLPGGEVALAWHVGSYETLCDTYTHLKRFASERGRTLTEEMWEVYWTDPSQERDSAQWRTQVFWPVKL